MYSTVGLIKHSKRSGKLIGTHQKLDRAARAYLSQLIKNKKIIKEFPTYKEIIYFEGMRGPDGLKRKSPGVDEPMHFIIPDHDDGKLRKMMLDHQHNLKVALSSQQKTKAATSKNSSPKTAPDDQQDYRTRAAFEAAWLAHTVTDGLTPAHHFPYQKALEELMTEKEYFTIFGQPVKGIMRGENLREAAKNNWKYWGVEGLMTKHVAFEYHVARIAARISIKKLIPKLSRAETGRLKNYQGLDLKTEFYASLRRIAELKMYDRFREQGWSRQLAKDTSGVLLPEVVKIITIAWLSALPEVQPSEIKKLSKKSKPALQNPPKGKNA